MLCISPALSGGFLSSSASLLLSKPLSANTCCSVLNRSTMSWISRPLPANSCCARWTAMMISLSGVPTLNRRNNDSIFGINALSLSGIAQAPLAVTTHLAAEVIQFGIEPRQQFAGARRLDHIDRAINCFLRQARVKFDLEVKSFA